MSYKRLTFEARYVIYHLIGVQANNMFEKEIAYFAESFRGRLADDMLDGVMSYVENDEDPLALEILCDHLIEDAIAMNDEDRTAGRLEKP